MDSLQIQSKLEQLETAPDTQKLRLYHELSWQLRYSDNSQAEELARNGFELATLLADSLYYFKLNSSLGVILCVQTKYDTGIPMLERSLDYFNREKDKKKAAQLLDILGYAASLRGDLQKADSLLTEAEAACKSIDDEDLLQNVYQSKGVNFFYWKKYADAKEAYLKSLELSEKLGKTSASVALLANIGIIEKAQNNYVKGLQYYLKAAEQDNGENKRLTANIFNNIGILYNEQEDYDKALTYHQQALDIRRKIGLKKYIASSLHNMGIVHYGKLNYGKALEYFEESLALKSEMDGSNNGLGDIINSIGNVHLELGDTREAEVRFKEYLRIETETKDTFGMCRAWANLAATYLKSGAYQDAIFYGKKSLETAERLPSNRMAKGAAESLSESYKAIGNYKQAFHYNNKYWQYRDSMMGAESEQKIAELELKYETAQKEHELDLKSEQLRTLQKTKEADRFKFGALVLACIVLLLIVGWLYSAYRKGKKDLIESRQRSEETVSEYRRENDLLKQRNTEQKQELDNYLKRLLDKSERLLELKEEVMQQSDGENSNALADSLNVLQKDNSEFKDGIKKFEYYFTRVHKDFFKNLTLAYPKLTTNDLNLCALIKLNLNNKEISQILGVSPDSVKKTRQRLYVKMALENNEALRNFIMQL